VTYSIQRVQTCKPDSMVTYATNLIDGNDTFTDQLHAMHSAVEDTITYHWQGGAANGAEARSVAEKVSGTHIATAVVGLADQYNTFGVQLDHLQQSLNNALKDAASYGMKVNDDGTVTAPQAPLTTNDSAGVLTQQRMQKHLNDEASWMQTGIQKLLGQFSDTETQAATAIANAHTEIDGYVQNPDGAPISSEVADIIAGKGRLPTDPKQLHDFWANRTAAEKDALMNAFPNLRNSDGIPADDRDHYNRGYLDDQMAEAAATGSDYDTLARRHPDWSKDPDSVPDGAPDYAAWQKAIPLRAADQALHPAGVNDPDRKLMLYDTASGKMTHIAVAVGDPDTAQHISVTSPGLGTTPDAIRGMTDEASSLRGEARQQLRLVHSDDRVSTIAWIGYDAPQIPLKDVDAFLAHPESSIGKDLPGVWAVSHDGAAATGAKSLAGFCQGLSATNDGTSPPQITAVGHSYGSLVTGMALKDLHNSGNDPVTDMVVYGSPGIEAGTPDQLGLSRDHAFVMRAPDDPIRYVFDAPKVMDQYVPGSGTLVPALLDNAGSFGTDPATNPNFTHMGTGQFDGTAPDGENLHLSAAHGHSDYPRLDGDRIRTTEYNIAAVLAGLPGNVIPQQ